MIQLVVWWHPACVKHDHLPAKVIITYRYTEKRFTQPFTATVLHIVKNT